MGNGKTILLVEDNPDDQALTLYALRKNHIANRVVLAQDGAEALDYLLGTGAHTGRDPADTPTLILLDLKLPKMDGIELLRRIRANSLTSRIPTVILTSSAEQKDIIDSCGLGANSYIRKPVDFDEFVHAVTQLGLYWLALNRPPT